MRSIFASAAATFGLLVAAPLHAQAGGDAAAVSGVVGAFASTIAKGDMAGFQALYVDAPTLLDEFAPFSWSGKGAIAGWLTDYGAWSKAHGITASKITLGAPEALNIAGDRAYVTVASTIVNTGADGKSSTDLGQFAFLLTKAGGTWKIAGWAYTRTSK